MPNIKYPCFPVNLEGKVQEERTDTLVQAPLIGWHGVCMVCFHLQQWQQQKQQEQNEIQILMFYFTIAIFISDQKT